MLNNNIKLTGRRIEEANIAYDNYVKAIAALEELGFEVVQDLDKVIDTKPIIINKGHIVTIETTNDEELERLYEENRRHIRRISQLSVENEQLTNDINELKAQLTKDADHETDNSTGCNAVEEQETKKGGDAMRYERPDIDDMTPLTCLHHCGADDTGDIQKPFDIGIYHRIPICC